MKNKIFHAHGDGQRVAIVGKSGSGKSYHARRLIAKGNIHFLVIDLKDDKESIAEDFYKMGLRVIKTKDEQKIYDLLAKFPIVIFTPDSDFSEDDFDIFLRDFYNNVRNVGILFDEAYLLKKSLGLNMILTRGRSRQISVISCTQRPVVCPTVCLSESNHFFIHSLNLPKDISTVAEFTGVEKSTIKDLKGYDFIYYGD